MIQAVAWKNDYLELLDQTLLPETTGYLEIRRIEEAFEAVQNLRVRGAPAIGITAAYGLYLGLRDWTGASRDQFFQAMEEKIRYLASARPTAVNLRWALEELRRNVQNSAETDIPALKERLLRLAVDLHEDDRRRCELMAQHGQAVVPENARIVTHCNTGALATGGIGTAFGVIYHAHRSGKKVQVFADETRPVLQGARLTMWELAAARIPSQLICDSMAASLMKQKQVDLVIVGADRIAADGSTANKIGTYPLAIAAKFHGVPFYVAAPLSTFDLSISSGQDIPIEMRNESEIRRVFNKSLITVPEAKCWNPAFDVTPPELITAIITERGIIKPPYGETIKAEGRLPARPQ
ncbi:MAG: S-methyl-5-thioribose-1-phosphate isomerase [Verrucomicrobia bacterium]|nr:S-methyl-5-thioribose-1-phosphate isomerase [Verrucomicrobiota bacterium]